MSFVTDRTWPRTPGFMNDPDHARELERLEQEIAAQELEDWRERDPEFFDDYERGSVA